MTDDALRERLESLRLEHRELDRMIGDLALEPDHDQLEVARMKKRKLRLKDEIMALADQIIPDIIA